MAPITKNALPRSAIHGSALLAVRVRIFQLIRAAVDANKCVVQILVQIAEQGEPQLAVTVCSAHTRSGIHRVLSHAVCGKVFLHAELTEMHAVVD
jgi:hypothetical protein